MPEKTMSRRTVLRMGAMGAAAVGFAGLGLSCTSKNEKDLAWQFAFEPDVYVDPKRDAQPASEAIKEIQGFTGEKPNIIVILTDDMGYGDLGCYGCKAIRTPNIDGLAHSGIRFTDFYSSNALCSPSRAGLLTGRYPHRTGVTFPFPGGEDTAMRKLFRKMGLVFGSLGAIDMQGGASLAKGLPASEITIAEALKLAGYQTACIGKWHLGDFTKDAQYLPRKHGFDYFIGFNGANDDWPVAFWQNETELVKDIGIDQARYTGLFTKEAIDFIERSKDSPFFLYLCHKDPHQPCIPSEEFKDASEGGRHGDTVQEVDWSVGEVIKCLQRNDLENDTLLIFTSDNGPWYDGSPGGLRGRKGQSFDGGYRVPMIARWPGKIAAGSICSDPSMNIDFLPTFLALAGLDLPSDRIIDGKNIWGLLTAAETESPHEALFFFHHNELEGVRAGKWKYFRHINSYVWPVPQDKPHTPFGKVAGGYEYKSETGVTVPALGSWPLLYNMDLDPGENYNLIKKYPTVAKQMQESMERWEREFVRNPRGWI
ncbi:MAG: arylsulfatase [Candidatus Abyssobacteria bacterium SURF_17]|uniref:Arylsulfatase n=1 Tax=Candidatus Abyssobacteria bacterium SURF_17 TaxID=2093361 RepID=A0A419EWA3_9BACT|nr:MAG: arylsulfatase [Candidatus Abyssubacteria bacterium SURF_17]